jgi:hypothetical protein
MVHRIKQFRAIMIKVHDMENPTKLVYTTEKGFQRSLKKLRGFESDGKLDIIYAEQNSKLTPEEETAVLAQVGKKRAENKEMRMLM